MSGTRPALRSYFGSPPGRVAAVETAKNQLSRYFRCSSILDFFNSIGAKRTCGRYTLFKFACAEPRLIDAYALFHMRNPSIGIP
jgi:hypothetical protein